jgi:hypothetical protein
MLLNQNESYIKAWQKENGVPIDACAVLVKRQVILILECRHGGFVFLTAR